MTTDRVSLPAPRYARVEGTTWPVQVGSIEWSLRYGDPSEHRLVAASVVNAYRQLTSPDITERDAIAALRRARKAATT